MSRFLQYHQRYTLKLRSDPAQLGRVSKHVRCPIQRTLAQPRSETDRGTAVVVIIRLTEIDVRGPILMGNLSARNRWMLPCAALARK